MTKRRSHFGLWFGPLLIALLAGLAWFTLPLGKSNDVHGQHVDELPARTKDRPLVQATEIGGDPDAGEAAIATRKSAAPDPNAVRPELWFDVLDATSGEPLADYTVLVEWDFAWRRVARSDRSGRVQLALPTEFGELPLAGWRVGAIEDSLMGWEFTFETGERRKASEQALGDSVRPDASRLLALKPGGRVAFEIGPRYFVELRGDERTDIYSARLLGEGASRSGSMPLRPTADGAHVVQFPRAMSSQMATSSDWTLAVEQRSGLAVGSASVAGSCLDPLNPVVIEMRRAVSLRGRVVDSEGNAVVGARLELIASGGASRIVKSDQAGEYGITNLDPGAAELVARRGHLSSSSTPVELVRGENYLADIVITAAANTSSVRGLIRSVSGSFSEASTVQLTAIANGTRASVPVEWGTNAAGDMVGRFEFEGVPAGRYDLSTSMVALQNTVALDVPCDELELMIDDEQGLRYEFRLDEAGTGEPILEFSVALNFGSISQEIDTLGGVVVFDVVQDEVKGWTITSAGMAALDQDDCIVTETGRVRSVLGRAARGWAKDVMVASEAHEPLGGVQILADGVEVATTDATGAVKLRLPAKPERIQFVLSGWSVVDGTIQADGSFDDRLPALFVLLAAR